jgi:ATP-dependent DNA helicase RecG
MSRAGAEAGNPRGQALTSLAGVGPARAAALARLGLTSVRGLLLLVPRRVELSGRRCTARAAATLVPGQGSDEVAVLGTLRGLRLFRAGRRRSVLSLEIVDESGALRALFFNQPWLFERLRALAAAGTRVELAGRIGRAKHGPALLAPRIDDDPPAERVERLVPVYPSTEGVGQELLARLIAQALERSAELVHELLPQSELEALGLPPLDEAVRGVHQPVSREEFARARRRLGFERLLVLQARLARNSAGRAGARARALRLSEDERRALLARLPFTPTAGQARVLAEIFDDLARERPMRRLLQGEVGAGKTLVALAACAAVAQRGGQAALLVPTELLGEQHFLGLGPALARFGLRAVLLSGSQRAAARRAALAELESGRAQLAIGTHALLGPGVRFARLDLCVIDEQQRFGVAQKQALLEKGADVHALLMTATPIPRTLALCYYGDLETSLLAERPPGRGPLVTRVAAESERAEIERFLAERARAGERAFWVCPRILPGAELSDGPESAGASVSEAEAEAEGESRADSASAEETFARLQRGLLAQTGLELMHGRLAPEKRAQAIERFRSGAAAVLVATSMVEVGVDVPEATVMVIEGAERFGLAQLHQLRGRVGRSHRPSWCFLFGAPEALERLRFLEGCADGFVLAEEDLRRRGMGDLAGLRQAGENLEGLDSEDLDLALVQRARALVRASPALGAHDFGAEPGAALV